MASFYKPVGRCIYCGETAYSENDLNRKLGEEHIIPLSLGGTLILPEASCQKCEAITSRIETACMPLYNPGRYHLGLRARKSKRERKKLPVAIGNSDNKILVDKHRHPGVLWGFRYVIPEILALPSPSGDEFSGNIIMAPAIPDFKERIAQMGAPVSVKVGVGVSQSFFGRFLAKIAHAYTAAEIGLGEFSPLLIDIIFGRNTPSLSWLIGSPLGQDDQPTSLFHEIKFVDLSRTYITVMVRLFPDRQLPPYYVVSGKRV
jgi:hypothetical protein